MPQTVVRIQEVALPTPRCVWAQIRSHHFWPHPQYPRDTLAKGRVAHMQTLQRGSLSSVSCLSTEMGRRVWSGAVNWPHLANCAYTWRTSAFIWGDEDDCVPSEIVTTWPSVHLTKVFNLRTKSHSWALLPGFWFSRLPLGI